MDWAIAPAVAAVLLGPMLVARLVRPKACPSCGSPKVRLIYMRQQAVIGWVLFLGGTALPGWWKLVAVAGAIGIIATPAGALRAMCLACRAQWPLRQGAASAPAPAQPAVPAQAPLSARMADEFQRGMAEARAKRTR